MPNKEEISDEEDEISQEDLDDRIKDKSMDEERRQTENCFHDWLSLGMLRRWKYQNKGSGSSQLETSNYIC